VDFISIGDITKNVVAVEESSIEYFNLPPGSTVTLLINEREHEMKVGGVVKDACPYHPPDRSCRGRRGPAHHGSLE
jgi:hypothetical protein